MAAQLPPEWLDVWRERVAIMEIDGRVSPDEAAAAALEDVRRMIARHQRRPVPCSKPD